MKLKTSKAFRHGTSTHRRGVEIVVTEAAGREIVKRGLAVEIEAEASSKAQKKASEPLDHDGNGKKGGSLPKAAKAADKVQVNE